jgi:processive 1,2-diacylglycerol beta-glucosyltransferase
MKVAILFFNFGGGHKEAAVNVKNAIEKLEPSADVRLFDGLAIAPRPIGWFWGALWNNVQSKNQGLWAIMYNWTFFSTRFWRYWQEWWMWWGMRREVAAFAPDHVLSAHFLCPPLAFRLRRKKKLSYTISHFLTEFVWHDRFDWHPFLNRYFICADDVKQKILEHGFPEEDVRMTGIPIKPAFEEPMERAAAREKLGISPKKLADKKVLFFFAGTFGGTNLDKILRGMKTRAVFPVVVCGRNEAVKAQVERLFADEGIDGIVYGFVDFMATIMSASDFMVGKGGALSVSECLALRVPIILYGSPPGNETGNAQFMQRVGAGIMADTIEDVLRLVDEMLANPDKLDAMRAAGAPHSFPRAAHDAAQVVVEMDQRLQAGEEQLRLKA